MTVASSSSILNHYEKLIAGAAILLLAGSAAYVVCGRASIAEAEREFNAELDRMKPANPDAAPADLSAYEAALADLKKPFQMNVSSNRVVGFMTPEERIWCVLCKKPIPTDAESCVFCGTVQPKPPEADPNFDTDGGGIPDAFELKVGLDIRNPKDDAMDSDGDGFSNLDEFRAGTDPMDPDSHPDIAAELRVRSIVGHKLPFRLRGKTQKPDGSFQCQINSNNQTFFVNEGGEIGKTGFKLVKFEPITEKRADERLGGLEREYDVSRATIERDGRQVVLVMDQATAFTDFDVVLVLPLDGTEIKTTNEGKFKLREKTYRVSEVDTESQSVVIFDESAGLKVEVPAE